jgi:hypothetical protein
MRELDFDIEASLERWTEWYQYEGDEDSESGCETHELSDTLYIKIMKHGYVNIDLSSPMSDYSCFTGRTDSSPLHFSDPDDQVALE